MMDQSDKKEAEDVVASPVISEPEQLASEAPTESAPTLNLTEPLSSADLDSSSPVIQSGNTEDAVTEAPDATIDASATAEVQVAPVETEIVAPTPVYGTAEPSPTPEPTPPPASQPTVIIQTPDPRPFLAKALEKIRFRKRVKLEKVVKLAGEKKSITNDQVEKLLRVSDATATRYLSQLVKDGRLQKIGNYGSSRYEPVSR